MLVVRRTARKLDILAGDAEITALTTWKYRRVTFDGNTSDPTCSKYGGESRESGEGVGAFDLKS